MSTITRLWGKKQYTRPNYPHFTQTWHHEEEEVKQLKSLVFHTLGTFSIYRHQIHHTTIVHWHDAGID